MRKLSATLSICAVAVCGLFLANCGDEADPVDVSSIDSTNTIVTVNDSSTITVSVTPGNGSYYGSITGRVASASDGILLSGVTVIATGDAHGGAGASETVVTDAEGYYQFDSLRLGAYQVTIDSAGNYSGKKTQVNVVVPAGHPAIGTESDVYVNVRADIDLLPLDADLSGSVYVDKDKPLKAVANKFPADGATVQVYVPNEIPDRYTATTDATGAFSISGLPATALRNIDATVIVLAYVDGDNTSFAQETRTMQLNSGTNFAPVVYMATVADPFVLLSANIQAIAQNSFGLTSDIQMTFSADVDATRLTGITLASTSGSVPVTVSASTNEITVSPDRALSASTDYTLSYTAYSTDGRSTGAQTIDFSTVKGLELVDATYYANDQSKKDVAIDEPIVLTFNMDPALGTNTEVELLLGTIVVVTDATVGTNTLTVTPSANLLPSRTYTLKVTDLESGIVGDDFDLSEKFNTESSPAPTGAVTGLTLEDSDFKADYNTTGVAIKWSKGDDAGMYNVYVKNDKSQNWQLLTGNTEVGDNFSNIQRHNVTLNDEVLDMILTSASVVEPFGLGAVCSLMVVPTNEEGREGDASTRAYMAIDDQVQPTIYNNAMFTAKSDVNMNNISGASVTIDFTVEFTEYMNTSSTPNLAIVGGGFGTVTFTNWEWGPAEGTMGKSQATFQMTIPNNVNLSTEEISISNVPDLSGNQISSSVVITLTDI